MTYWRDFSTPPLNGQKVMVVYPRVDGQRDIALIEWNHLVAISQVLFWMPAPELPDEAPKGTFEVPKDGRTYLCWTGCEGYVMVYWDMNMSRYQDRNNEECLSQPAHNDIQRYMDASGKWVER